MFHAGPPPLEVRSPGSPIEGRTKMFIQVMQGEIKDIEGSPRSTMDRWREEVGPAAEGYIGGTFGVADDGQLVVVVRFDSEEAARRNSDRPEQGAWWSDISAHFAGDVEVSATTPRWSRSSRVGRTTPASYRSSKDGSPTRGRFRDMVEPSRARR